MRIPGVLIVVASIGFIAVTGCSSADVADGSSDSADALRRGQTILRVPLLDRDGKFLSTHNAALTAAGLDTFEEDYVDFDSTNLEAGLRKWNAAGDLVDAAQEKDLSLEMERYGEPADYAKRDGSGICWKGNARKAVGMVGDLSDAVFSDQLSVHGWRYKHEKETEVEDESFMPAIWREWRGQGEAILMITASSDDGGETNVGLIPKCR